MNVKLIQIYADGACQGNPGPGGWGAVLRYHTLNAGMKERELFGHEAATTNNRMELMAVIAALEAVQPSLCVNKIEIYTDSQYVQKGMSEWIHRWQRNNWMTAAKTPVKNVDLWQRLAALTALHSIQWYWIKGHAGHPENERADRLARKSIAVFHADRERA